jgi:type II secretory pathway pseudopilin PulG
MTLIELLVVISIILLLAAATLPRLKPAIEERRLREASRAVHLIFNAARQAAIATGRPAGVMIERLTTVDLANPSSGPQVIQPSCSMLLTQVQVPPPYAGDTLSANATVSAPSDIPNWPGFKMFTVTFYEDFGPTAAAPSAALYPGDRIQFNMQGPWYVLGDPDADPAVPLSDRTSPKTMLPMHLDCRRGEMVPWPVSWGATLARLPYQILRKPIKSGATPLQLPAGTVVDLPMSGQGADAATVTDASSGTGSTVPVDLSNPQHNPKNWAAGAAPIIVMFSPSGSVERVLYPEFPEGRGKPAEPDSFSTIYLLIGRRDKMDPDCPRPSGYLPSANLYVDTAKPDTSERVLTNLWVAINPRTGMVTTESVAPRDPLNPQDQTKDHNPRRFAREGQNMGGR